MNNKEIIQKIKCPICKKKMKQEGHMNSIFFQIDKSEAYVGHFCSKKCLDEGKIKGLWK